MFDCVFFIRSRKKKFRINGLTPHKSSLVVGPILLLLRNLNVQQGLASDTRFIIKIMSENSLELEIITGIIYQKCHLSKRRQFFICLAFCMTINKTQGQIFYIAVVNRPIPVVSHGPLYVALSQAVI